MCKLFTLTNTKKLRPEQLEKLTKVVQKNMTTERDGFGIVAKKLDGSIYVRRFLNPSDATLKQLKFDYPFEKPNQNQDGTPSPVYDSIVFHGRTSTNNVSLINTHPIVRNGITLCHNGVVEDSGPKYSMLTSNDTEHVVERLSQGIGQLEKHISGYYATMSYQDNSKVLTVIKDNIASLFFVFVPSLDAFCFATTKDLIENSLKAIGVKHHAIKELQDNLMLTIQGSDILSQASISPKGRSSYADSLASKSLGRVMDDDYIGVDDVKNEDYPVSQTEEQFLDMVHYEADASWVFIHKNQEIGPEIFFDMSSEDQLDCLIVREDGTIISVDERLHGKFFDQGLMA